MLDSSIIYNCDSKQYSIEESNSRLKKLLIISKVAVPSILTFVFSSLSELINTIFIGRELDDPHMLAGAGMGNIIICMTCICVFQGMNGALET
jgi:Na+-driven multidrug efflux pump